MSPDLDPVARADRRRALLADLGADAAVQEELSVYLREHYERLPQKGDESGVDDEPQVPFWRGYVEEAGRDGVAKALRRRFPQLGFPIGEGLSQLSEYREATRKGQFGRDGEIRLGLEKEELLSLSLSEGFAGAVPVLVARHRPDFVRLVRALTARNEPEAVPDAMGACLVKGLADWDRVAAYRAAWEKQLGRAATAEEWSAEMASGLAPRKELWQDRLILLSDGPYSAVPAAELGLDEAEWRERSLALRLAHESFHYLTLRLAGSIRSHLLDELVADYAGLTAAFGRYEAGRALRFLGLDRLPAVRPEGRLAVYRGDLSDGAVAVLSRLVAQASANLERRAPDAAPDASAARARLLALAELGLDGIAGDALGERLGAGAPAAPRRSFRWLSNAASLDEVARAAADLDAWAVSCVVADGARRNLLLAFDELASNVVKYSRGATLFEVRARRAATDGVLLAIEDDGPRFDPWALAEPDTDLALADREPGGLGIHLVKRLARRVSFRYVRGRNRVVVEVAPAERS